MNNKQLISILKADKYTVGYEILILARDEFLPEVIPIPSLIILNTDIKLGPGEHWIGIYVSNRGIAYFDSYGLPPLFDSVITTLKHLKERVKHNIFSYNNTQIQGFNSAVCGQYSLMYLLLSIRGFSMNNIIKKFQLVNTFEQRDHVINYAIIVLFSQHFDTLPLTHDPFFNFQSCKSFEDVNKK